MKFLSTTLVLIFALTFSNMSYAQSSVGNQNFQELVKMEVDFMKGFTSYQKAIFDTEEDANIIIDFQEIPVNLKSIKILDANAHIIYTEDVQDLPVDALYELDMSRFPAGSYTLQLDAYASTFFIDLSE